MMTERVFDIERTMHDDALDHFRNCYADVTKETHPVMRMQGLNEDTTVMEYIFVHYIEGGYSEPRMSALSERTVADLDGDEDLIIEYVLDRWAADDDVVLAIALGKAYGERTIYTNKSWGID